MSERLHYIDWLRVISFGILIVYHSAAGFFPDNFWLISSPHSSESLAMIMEHPRVWRLALLFFISGVGTYFAFRKLSNLDFLSSRVFRLVIPLLFAMAVLCVPQVWYERMLEDGYQGNLIEFWVQRYFSEGKYPTGHITWAHVWFIGYLVPITFVFFPVMKILQSGFGERVAGWFEVIAIRRSLYLLFLVPLALNLVLSPWFPRPTNALYNDLAWFSVYLSWFACGYFYACCHQAINRFLFKKRWEVLLLTIGLSVAMYILFWVDLFDLEIGSFLHQTSIYKAFSFALSWMMILSIVTLAHRFLNVRNNFIAYANKSVYALYLIHQTVVVGLLYYAIKLDLTFMESFAFVTIGTFALSLLIYHFLIRNLGFWKILFGFGIMEGSWLARYEGWAKQKLVSMWNAQPLLVFTRR